ncbi:hypothetical protein HNP46_004165 [Pseudomonas nitritireducens]|uniref:Uncharacterized protein n=1 Tax=Pseudomonas nitroreducens TaxID=46680 RepID=A0A7W7KMZ0_PSENT|nr:hypothetical protein [Pseudomonas nitritireducens]MBB4865284.1 hypothetical protein [Pseudomonas nitritireducens]
MKKYFKSEHFSHFKNLLMSGLLGLTLGGLAALDFFKSRLEEVLTATPEQIKAAAAEGSAAYPVTLALTVTFICVFSWFFAKDAVSENESKKQEPVESVSTESPETGA